MPILHMKKIRPRKIKFTKLVNRKTKIQMWVCFNPHLSVFSLKDLIRHEFFLTETKRGLQNLFLAHHWHIGLCFFSKILEEKHSETSLKNIYGF